MTGMRAVAFALALGTACGAGAEPAYEVCEEQLRRYVAEQLGHTVRAIRFNWGYRSGPRNVEDMSEALVYVEECDGAHQFDIFEGMAVCRWAAHYGTPPDYVGYRGASGGCRAAAPPPAG